MIRLINRKTVSSGGQPGRKKSNRHTGFTLMELLIAITLLSIIMLYLYESLSTLRSSNTFYGEKLAAIAEQQKLLNTLYLDLALTTPGSVDIQNQEKSADIVLMQTSHSVHQRIMPYVGYIFNNNKLYRIESSQKISYPLYGDEEMVVDDLGPTKHFRLYQSRTHFLVDMQREGEQGVLYKIRALNQ